MQTDVRKEFSGIGNRIDDAVRGNVTDLDVRSRFRGGYESRFERDAKLAALYSRNGERREPSYRDSAPNFGLRAADEHERRDLDDGSKDRDLPQRTLYEVEDAVEDLAEYRMPAGIGKGEGVVAGIAVAVPALGAHGELGQRVGAGELHLHRVVDAPVHVHEADVGQALLAREAARRLRRDGVGGVGRAVCLAHLAPDVPPVSLRGRR